MLISSIYLFEIGGLSPCATVKWLRIQDEKWSKTDNRLLFYSKLCENGLRLVESLLSRDHIVSLLSFLQQ